MSENKALVVVDKNLPKPDMYYIMEGEINKVKTDIASGFLRLGMIFKLVKEKELWKVAHDTFATFIASFGFSYSSVRSWIHIYELYVLKLGRPQEELQAATWGQLQVINPVVESDPDEWIGKAQELSRGDLINEVRESQGKEAMEPRSVEKEEPSTASYEAYVESYGCAVGGPQCSGGIEKAHFPHTKGRSGAPWHYIPLCHFHHIEDLHRHGINHFLLLHKYQIFIYFYGYIGLHSGTNATSV